MEQTGFDARIRQTRRHGSCKGPCLAPPTVIDALFACVKGLSQTKGALVVGVGM